MRSKIVLGSFLLLALFGAACDKYSNTTAPTQTTSNKPSSIEQYPSVTTTTPPTSGLGSGLGVISTPKPASGIDENSPAEPDPYQTSAPFILGKSAPGFNGSTDPSATPEPTVVVPGKISGHVYGYDNNTRSYKALAYSTVSINGTSITTDGAGRYTTSDVINDRADISGFASGYLTSTVSGVAPGDNRDIHLQPIDSSQVFNQNTITSEIITLSGKEPTAANVLTSTTPSPATAGSATPIPSKDYPSVLAFGDKNNSRFVTTLLDSVKGRIRVEVNPIANQTTAQGQLFIYNIERDNSGKPTNPTQIKTFIYKKDITFRVGDTLFPDLVKSTDSSTTTSEDQAAKDAAAALANFVNINVKFNDSYGFSNFVCNAYVIFPTGEKVLASKYVGSTPTNLSFRLPKITTIPNLSYAIEAHAGDSSLGSDVVVRDLHAGDSVEAYLLQPPSGLTPGYDSTGNGTAPIFSWNAVRDAKAYQPEVKNTDVHSDSAWEGFTQSTTIKYPTGLKSLTPGGQYRFQVVAMDFSYGGLSVLSANKAEDMRLRVTDNKSNELPFKVQLNTLESAKLPKGYRVSYNTVLFRAK